MDDEKADQVFDAVSFRHDHAATFEQLAAAGGIADAFGREALTETAHVAAADHPVNPTASPPYPLTRERVLALLREHAPELEQRYGVRPVALFGSVARNEARPDSDVDVLVEYLRPPGLREFMGAIEYMEAVFGTRVDLGAFEDLKPRAAAYVARELVRVA